LYSWMVFLVWLERQYLVNLLYHMLFISSHGTIDPWMGFLPG
jgi:hypothetical protein